MVKIKNVAFSVFAMTSVSLCAMEIELQKTEDSCVVKKALFCAEIMKQYGIPQEIASIIACKSYSLRMAEIYKKFDPFFHFDNDHYHVMRSEHLKKISTFADQHAQCGDTEIEKFHKLNPYNIDLCRKCDVVASHNLFFLTEKQDIILLTLTSLPKRFIHTKGTMILNFDNKEHEQYLMLPAALLDLLSKYTMNTIDEWKVSSGEPHQEVVSNQYSGSFMNDF